MKYGLIVFNESDNLGDDIQSYATSKYLPQIDYQINREQMHSFYPFDGRQFAVICSGWYLYEHLNWPPSPYFIPLNISMHFDTYYSKCWGNSLDKNLVLEGYGAEWLSKHAPIGARDETTLLMLKSFNINTYFSGCITLTIKPFKSVLHHNKIVAVDIGEELLQYLKKHVKEEIIIKTHKIKLGNYSIKERFSMVEEYLKLYQGARLIVTTRLHAALPAIALGTPVLFVKDTRFYNRTSTYIPYIYSAFPEEIISNKKFYDFNNPFPSSNFYINISNDIEHICNLFVNNTKDKEGKLLTPLDITTDMRKRTEHANLLLKRYYQNYTDNL